MSSPAMASMMPSPGPSNASLAAHRSFSQRPIASPSASIAPSSLKPAPVKASSSRLAPAPSSTLAPAPVQPLVAVKSASSSVPSAALASSASVTPSVPKKDASGGPLVQPSKEWVLPARAKPGRKPSETEPLTKRKAQNRASQRAFRERKQSYLSELEAKVAAYEAAEIDRSVEIQKVAQKLRAENEALRKEAAGWKDKFVKIEKYLLQAKANGGRLPGVTPSVKSGPGCKAPAHERAAAVPKRGVLVAPGTKSERDRERSAGSVRFADVSTQQSETSARSSVEDQPAAAVPLRRKPASVPAVVFPVDAASPSTATSVSMEVDDAQTPAVSSSLIAPRKGPKPPLWSFETTKPTTPPATGPATAAESADKAASLLSPSLLSHAGHLDGGCGFCTEASPCVCADDFLDLSKPEQPSHIAVASDVPSAVPLPKRTTTSSASETSRRMSIGSLTHAKDVALDQRKRAPASGNKLWYTVAQQASPPSVSTAAVPLSLRGSTKPKTSKKLWSVIEAPAEPVCTGDPSTCGACSTDPGLAAFCEAVTTATTAPSTSSSILAIPLSSSPARPIMARAGTTGQLASTSHTSRGETIPSAWRQIRSHPRFSQWQGGLDLLAEVVSKRSGNSPLLSQKRPREASVEIESSTTSMLATSNDRATAKPSLLHTTSDTIVYASTSVKIEDDDDDARESKRSRILIDREAVQEALALLDAGTAKEPRGSVGLGIREEQPCPCPWRPGEKRSP
ncbi:Basic-leucine zipper domain protein [Kalmanozyma brasiliensis GHG001]|uniref:Basic-leucine zipper domain protein n=1 Tax=Kalmanozyma brasiliensis (strain GHG001) TaxID=1365824 RepID=UPI001CE838B7|nr:Basic-leucine zipper domain protein [Kalmanozyma brasiliensis GHG001]EST04799.2 Basic-leucine zipper domain protein [Kalmanozyma brasiliensis GHG001]